MKKPTAAPRDGSNVPVEHGRWGEAVATEYLRRGGYEIIEVNSRPVSFDGRLEIDIVSYDRSSDTLVFVEVKQHKSFSPYARRLRSIDKRKRANLRIACNVWRRMHGWERSFRFDVIEIYGIPGGGRPEIDHIRQVNLFPAAGRFVKWSV